MRRINSAGTLRTLHGSPPLTLAEITAATGLSRRTVEFILDDLVRDGWVVEQKPDEGNRGVGRPARRFSFVPGHRLAMAVHIAQESIEAAVCDLHGTPLGRWSTPVPAMLPREERLAATRSLILQAQGSLHVPRSRIAAVTVGTMGVVHDDSEVNLWVEQGIPSPSQPGWSGFSLSDALAGEFDCPVVAENDANLAAIGERWRGAALGVGTFVDYFLIGSRGGLGIITDGRVHRGHDGHAGEIVWTEELLGLGARLGKHVLAEHHDPSSPRGREAVEILAAARRGESPALAAIDDYAAAMAPGLNALIWILAPEVLVLGGSLSTMGDLLVPAVTRALARYRRSNCEVRASPLGIRAVTEGGLRMSLDRIEDALFSAE